MHVHLVHRCFVSAAFEDKQALNKPHWLLANSTLHCSFYKRGTVSNVLFRNLFDLSNCQFKGFKGLNGFKAAIHRHVRSHPCTHASFTCTRTHAHMHANKMHHLVAHACTHTPAQAGVCFFKQQHRVTE
jgi:hypothetical protein